MARISVRHSFCFWTFQKFDCLCVSWDVFFWVHGKRQWKKDSISQMSGRRPGRRCCWKSANQRGVRRYCDYLFFFLSTGRVPYRDDTHHTQDWRSAGNSDARCRGAKQKQKKTCCLLKISQEFRVLVLRFHCLVGHAGELRSAETNNKTPFKYLSTVRVHIHVERERDASDLAILVSAPPTLSKSAGVLRLESHHIVRLRTIDGTSSTKRDTRASEGER